MKKLKASAFLVLLPLIALLSLRSEKKENFAPEKRKPASAMPSAVPVVKNEISSFTLNKLVKEIETLASCYEKDCGRKSVDPRTDFYSLGQELKLKLTHFENYVSEKHIRSSEILDFAIQFLSHSDGHIQEVALDILSTQEISEIALDAILENIINGIDAKLIHQALLELSRYKSIEDQEKIRRTLGYALLHGTPFVAEAIADGLEHILTAQNIAYFESLIKALDPKSKIYQSVLFSIQEFDQKAQAG